MGCFPINLLFGTATNPPLFTFYHTPHFGVLWRGQDTEGGSVQDTADSAIANMAPHVLVLPSTDFEFPAPLEFRFVNVMKETGLGKVFTR